MFKKILIYLFFCVMLTGVISCGRKITVEKSGEEAWSYMGYKFLDYKVAEKRDFFGTQKGIEVRYQIIPRPSFEGTVKIK